MCSSQNNGGVYIQDTPLGHLLVFVRWYCPTTTFVYTHHGLRTDFPTSKNQKEIDRKIRETEND